MRTILGLTILGLGLIAGCSGNSGDIQLPGTQTKLHDVKSRLTDFQMRNGIGPITEPIELAAIDKELAQRGEKLFKTNCSACHKLDERYVGPAQRDLVERRSPEYIINMIMNPNEMLQKNPEAKKMLSQYMTPMPNMNVSLNEARALLEYFRYVDVHKKVTEVN
ncbi:MAG TPA: cytochrome c [Balneolaceae bacterium]|nr:cytochrome c [Balneolaceae bacterium]